MSQQKIELASPKVIRKYTEDLHQFIDSSELTKRRAFIKSFVKELRVTGNEAVLAYTMPILLEKITIEKEGVPPTVQYSGW